MSNKLLLSVAGFLLVGCAQVPMKPERFSHELKQTQDKAFQSALRALAQDGYVIKVASKETGIITTEPKEFVVERGVLKVQNAATSEVQVMFADKAASTTVTFRCGYGAYNNSTQSACWEADNEAKPFIEKEKARIEGLLRKSL
jgi:predicted RNA-binding protein with PIN domain